MSTARTIANGAAEAGGGRALPAGLRETMERAFGTDLSAVRIHSGGEADGMARALGAEAFACGSAVFFRDGAYRPDTRSGLRLLAHELAHVVQQARGDAGSAGWSVSRPGDRWEFDADRCAERVLRGEVAPRDANAGVVVTAGPSRLIQRHASYEHRILGDGPTDDLVAASLMNAAGKEFLRRQIRLLDLWSVKPQDVKRSAVEAAFAGTKTFYLGPDKVLVTYGELNALPDYLPDAASYETIGAKTLMPILQVLRQEGYNALYKLLNKIDPWKDFEGSVVSAKTPEKIYMVKEIVELDGITFGRGADGKDHYAGILARNACHFAPYTWYRWKFYHALARNQAELFHSTKNEKFEQLAWMYHGYADHFLQDSFAAGHLINKTLVMQWFVEWASAKGYAIADLDDIKQMGLALQPQLSAPWLYDADDPGPSPDPQTAQQAASVVARFLDSNVVSDRGSEEFATYQKYLTFVTSAAANLAAVDIHNYYNENSLWVSSTARPRPYKVWGDVTLLSGAGGAEGVGATSEAAQLSQRSLREILATGKTPVSMDQIRSHFPTRAGTRNDNLGSLRSWNETNRAFCESIFGQYPPVAKKWLATLVTPRLGIVSEDQRFAGIWHRQIKELSLGVPEILISGGRVFVGSNGYIAELDPATGAIKQRQLLPSSLGAGKYTTRLATDGKNLYAGVHGSVYAAPLDNLRASTWPACNVGGTGIYATVKVLVVGGRLYAGSAGYVYEIDSRTGQIRNWLRVAQVPVTSGIELAADNARLYVGLPRSVAAVALNDWKKLAWSWPTGNTNDDANTEVLLADGRVYGGVHGNVFALDPGTGRIVTERQLTKVTAGSDFSMRIGTDSRRLYAGYNGSVYAVGLGNWNVDWQLKVGAKEDFSRVQVLPVGDRVYVGSQGYAYDVAPETGVVRDSQLLAILDLDPLGQGYPTFLAAEDRSPEERYLFAGVNGYVYKILAQSPWMEGTVAHDWYDGRWHGWENDFDGARHMQDVTAVMGPDNLEVFGIGRFGAVFHNWYDGRWHRWEANFRDAPFMRSISPVMGPTQLEVLGIGVDDQLYWNWYDGEWHHWDKDPIGLVRQVTGIRIPGGVCLFVVRSNGTVRYDVYNVFSKNWTGWLDLDAPVAQQTNPQTKPLVTPKSCSRAAQDVRPPHVPHLACSLTPLGVSAVELVFSGTQAATAVHAGSDLSTLRDEGGRRVQCRSCRLGCRLARRVVEVSP